MSKYLMNKLIHQVNMNQAAEREYTSNPREFVENWEKGQKLKFTPEEREALATKDYGKLYALGAHPFTLWSFTEAVWVHDKPREELVADATNRDCAVGEEKRNTWCQEELLQCCVVAVAALRYRVHELTEETFCE